MPHGYDEGEQIITLKSGERKIYYSFRGRITDSAACVAGRAGILPDITRKKKAESLRLS